MKTHKDFSPAELASMWRAAIDPDVSADLTDQYVFIFGDTVEMAIHEPEKLWEFIIECSKLDLADRESSRLGAGPLEELLSYNGKRYIDEVIQSAKNNSVINDALRSVWPRSSMTEDVRSKLISHVSKSE